MFNFFKTLKGMAAIAAAVVLLAGGMAPLADAQAKQNWKDTAEYDLYNEVNKGLAAKNYTKAVTDLDTWKQKYAESDFKDLRDILYLQAYSESKQYNKLLAVAAPLLERDLDKAFPDPKSGPSDVIKILFFPTTAITQIQNPTPAELATGEKAARTLLSYNRKPEGMADDAWNSTRTQLQNAAKAALLYIAVVPGTVAMAKNPKDCATAETVFSKALSDYPDNAWLAYQLGLALNCLARTNTSKAEEYFPRAIYAFTRAVVLDPTLGGTQNASTITDYLTKAYTGYHGDTEGLEQLKQQAKASPVPPAGFKIKTASEIAQEKEKEFKEKYPQLALWLNIKAQLAGPEGEAYFTSSMKDAKIPKLKGTLVEAKPACRAKELLVSFPEPNQQGTAPAVVTLKLDAPLKGKVEPGAEIQWEGVPSAFTKEPFMLTMDTDMADITGLSPTACTPAAAPKAAPKRPAGKKK